MCKSMSEREWIFTFCSRHEHPKGYVVIYGTYETARAEMFRRYNTAWGFQYKSKELAGVSAYKLYEMKKDGNAKSL